MSCIKRSLGTCKARKAHQELLVFRQTLKRSLASLDPLLLVQATFIVLRDFASFLEVHAIIIQCMAACHDQRQQLCHLLGKPLQPALKLHKCKQHGVS